MNILDEKVISATNAKEDRFIVKDERGNDVVLHAAGTNDFSIMIVEGQFRFEKRNFPRESARKIGNAFLFYAKYGKWPKEGSV